MITVKNIADYFHGICPPELAFNGDNVGLIVGREEKEVKKILLTLDVDEMVADEAKRIGADMIVSHHPLMFHPIKRLKYDDPMQRTLISLVSADIPLFSAHTNLDTVSGGLNDYLAGKLGISNTDVIEPVSELNGAKHGFGRIGEVEDGITLEDMIERCKTMLNTPSVKYVGSLDKIVKRAAVNCGGGADEIDICIQRKADLFITGDVKYNPARDCYENGMALIDAGHYETEHIVCELFSEMLSKEFNDLEFVISDANTPVWNYR